MDIKLVHTFKREAVQFFVAKNLAVNHLSLETLPAVQTWTANVTAKPWSRDILRFAGLQFSMKNLMLKVSILILQNLKRRLNDNALICEEITTNWAPRTASHIMFLDRHNVKCPRSYFLTRFQLDRKGSYDAADVNYSYMCCYLWIY